MREVYYKVLKPDLTSVGLLGASPLQYKIDEWVYPLEPLSDHPRKGGGLWVVKRKCDAFEYKRYLLKQHNIKARIFICLIGMIIYQSNRRTKTSKVKITQEIFPSK